MTNRMTHQAHLHHREDAAHHPDHSGAAISIMKLPAIQGETLVVTSPAVDLNGAIDPAYSADQSGPSPALEWGAVEDAGAFALIVEDPDAPQDQPFVHWMIWNLPGQSIGLPQGVPAEVHLITPQDALQGPNDAGTIGWYGPKPPAGHGIHRYHFQLFALDGPLTLHPDGVDVRTLVDAMRGRVVRSGELVGTFETPDDAPGEAG